MMTPIYKAITDYISKDMSKFHMPGHKGKDIYNINDLWKYDITEIEGLDNLLNSRGIIKQTEDMYKEIYKSYETVITTQGSTLGIQIMLTAALMALGNKSNKIIIDRNAHVSAINVMALLDIDPIWIFPDKFINNFMSGLISEKSLEEKILGNPDVNIVYITSPNYFGQMMDLKSISSLCKKYNKVLLIDNAHGAHLKFISHEVHPMDCGCNCCCDSLHKTLPALTGAGLVHCLDQRLALYLKKAQRLYSSTSPSYLTMLSIDLLLGYISSNVKSEIEDLVLKISELKKLAEGNGFEIARNNIDPIKFVIGPGIFNCSTRQIYNILKNYKIEPEYIDDYWVLLIFGIQNERKDFERVKNAIVYMNKTISKKNVIEVKQYNYNPIILKRGMSIREAVFSRSKRIKTVDSIGYIASSSVVTCPPCVPVITPGEIISYEVIEILLSKKIYFVDVVFE